MTDKKSGEADEEGLCTYKATEAELIAMFENDAAMRRHKLDPETLGKLVEHFKDCTDELEASGYSHDHPSLVKYRSALPPQSPEDRNDAAPNEED